MLFGAVWDSNRWQLRARKVTDKVITALQLHCHVLNLLFRLHQDVPARSHGATRHSVHGAAREPTGWNGVMTFPHQHIKLTLLRQCTCCEWRCSADLCTSESYCPRASAVSVTLRHTPALYSTTLTTLDSNFGRVPPGNVPGNAQVSKHGALETSLRMQARPSSSTAGKSQAVQLCLCPYVRHCVYWCLCGRMQHLQRRPPAGARGRPISDVHKGSGPSMLLPSNQMR